MIFTMLAIDKQNAAKVKEVTTELVRQYDILSKVVRMQPSDRSVYCGFVVMLC